MRMIFAALAGVFLSGCGADSELAERPTPNDSVGVTQGGAADIGAFRAMIEAGDVPPVSTLDEVGFFAEHALGQPVADCGQAICAHPSLAIAPRFDGGNWAMALVSLNSSVDPATRPRDPLHLVIAIEASPYTEGWLSTVESHIAGVGAGLRAEDRVSVLLFGYQPRTLFVGLAPSTELTPVELTSPQVSGPVDLFSAIVTAQSVAGTLEGFQGDARVLLMTSGHAEGGITERDRIAGLAWDGALAGIGLSVIGFGDEVQLETVQALGNVGTGTYAVATSTVDLANAISTAAETGFVPIAHDLELEVTAAEGYRVGRVYGARAVERDEAHAILSAPAIYLGTRTGAEDVDTGRRGGGGGFFVELQADSEASLGADLAAFTVDLRYTDAETGALATAGSEVINPLAPGENPPDNWPMFTDVDRGKAFMMLNMYLALRTAVELYEEGNCAEAQGVVEMMQLPIDLWQERFDDPDIDADAVLLDALGQNVASRCTQAPVRPAIVTYGCFGI